MNVSNLKHEEAEKFYSQGFHLVVYNARTLFSSAELAANAGNIGVGCSLMILSTEEAIKATMCAIKYNDPNFPLAHWDEVFKYHNIKHEHIKGSLILLKVKKMEADKFQNEVTVKMTEMAIALGIEPSVLIDQFYKKMSESADFEKFFDTPEIDDEEVLNWWATANKLKNDGLYVNKTDHGWKSPNLVTREDYDIAKKFASYLNIIWRRFDGLL